MKTLKLTKAIVSTLVIVSVLVLKPIEASAEWKQDSIGWWYTEGSSWAVGWKLIDGKWYYFGKNGYMVHDTTINGYKIGSDGAWNESVKSSDYGFAIEFSGVTSESVRIPFNNFYQGAAYLEKNDSSFWMQSYRYIADDTQWKVFRKAYLPDMDEFPSINFQTESLYIVASEGVNGFVRSLDIKELTYNKKTFTVIISQKDSKVIYGVQDKTPYWISIVKINKVDFPTGERDWLMIPEKKSINKLKE